MVADLTSLFLTDGIYLGVIVLSVVAWFMSPSVRRWVNSRWINKD